LDAITVLPLAPIKIMNETLLHAVGLKKWRLAGIFALSVLGFLLHYIFTWTQESRVLGFFVPVNESVWEHLKLGYLSLVLFSVPEYFQIRKIVHNYFLSKLIGILALELSILLIFYSYSSIIGKSIFYIDILSYILGVIACQYLSYTLFRYKPLSGNLNRLSLLAFIAIGILFGISTYHPPHADIFMDHRTKTFGIHKEK
jgi:hypothetical protein